MTEATNKTGPTVLIWCLSDGKAGHEKQTRGLVQALSSLLECNVVNIETSFHPHQLWWFFSRQFPLSSSAPTPDLIIAAGHQTHLAALTAKRATGAKTIVLMKPSLPCRLFDLCVIPKHDQPPTHNNILATKGVINTQRPSESFIAGSGLILIGGPSRHYGWNTPECIKQLQSIIGKESRVQWTLCDSRRTPADMAAALAKLAAGKTEFVHHADCDKHWLDTKMANTEFVWVSEDSVSMLYEAITAKRKTGLIPVTIKKQNKISTGISSLLEEKMMTHFDVWQEGNSLQLPAGTLDEAGRVASYIKEHLLHGK